MGCSSASRAPGLCDWNSRVHAGSVVARPRLAVAAGDVASPGSVGSVVGGATLLTAVAAVPAAVPDSVEHADDFAPNAVAAVPAAVPDSAGHAGGFAPNAVAAPHAVTRDSTGAAVVRRAVVRPAVAQLGVEPVELAVVAHAVGVATSDELPAPPAVGRAAPDFPDDFPGEIPGPAHGPDDLARS